MNWRLGLPEQIYAFVYPRLVGEKKMVSKHTDPQKNIFIREKREEFSQLEEKFEKMTDPIERYIKRQEMIKIRNQLEPFGVKLNIP